MVAPSTGPALAPMAHAVVAVRGRRAPVAGSAVLVLHSITREVSTTAPFMAPPRPVGSRASAGSAAATATPQLGGAQGGSTGTPLSGVIPSSHSSLAIVVAAWGWVMTAAVRRPLTDPLVHDHDIRSAGFVLPQSLVLTQAVVAGVGSRAVWIGADEE